MLYDALTHMPIRRETDAERRSAAAAREVGDVDGWIVVDGRLCYVRSASTKHPRHGYQPQSQPGVTLDPHKLTPPKGGSAVQPPSGPAPSGQQHLSLRVLILAEMRRRQYGVGELARLAGVSRPWLSRWLTKPGRLAREDTLDRLRKALGL